MLTTISREFGGQVATALRPEFIAPHLARVHLSALAIVDEAMHREAAAKLEAVDGRPKSNAAKRRGQLKRFKKSLGTLRAPMRGGRAPT